MHISIVFYEIALFSNRIKISFRYFFIIPLIFQRNHKTFVLSLKHVFIKTAVSDIVNI